MAISQNQRLRKAAAKAAKRKAVAADKLARERRALAISKPRHIDLAAAPIVACTMTQDWETSGMGTLLVARRLALGRYGAVFFLLDTWCLGVKDAFFRVLDTEEYESYREEAEEGQPSAAMDPGLALKLVTDAAAYGAANGFPPADDFGEMLRIFGDVAPAQASFAFGDEGVPHYVAGPDETNARVRLRLKQLERTLGPNGFKFTDQPSEDELEYEDE